MQRLKVFVLMLTLGSAATLLGACASGVPGARPESLFADRLFGPPTEPVSSDGALMVDAAMRRYLEVDIEPQLRREGLQTGLIDALYKHSQLRLDYDTGRTRTASEAFAARSGNCLSLVLMTAALAHALRLPVVYQSAYLDETWSRNGDMLFASGHVNITVGRGGMDAKTSRTLSPLTVDFLPAQAIAGMRTHEIGERTVLAMFANNRAAESLAQGRIDDAYAWAVEATRQDAAYVSAYNTLGVVYLRHGNVDLAVATLEHALGLDPHDTRAMANLVLGYERAGKPSAAQALQAQLAAIEPFPPVPFLPARPGRDGAQRLAHRARPLHPRNGTCRGLRRGPLLARPGQLASRRRRRGRQAAALGHWRQHDAQPAQPLRAKLAWLKAQSSPANGGPGPAMGGS